jgi:predicted secreted hydrolase
MRSLLAAFLFAFTLTASAFDPVVAGRLLRFPDDAGAHPGHRVEWWYVTGHLDSAEGPFGFQVTFFRVRHKDAESNPSRFSPRQILFAHAAISDPRRAKITHDQRIARSLPPIVEARAGATDVRIEDWTLKRDESVYRTRVSAEGFQLDLAFAPTQPVLLQGDRGFSRKGPVRGQSLRGQDQEPASYYYSEPQLSVSGRIAVGPRSMEVTGVAWLDHEWASELLVSGAVGWDWIGVNLDDGGALMAFRIRDAAGQTVWAGATLRGPKGEPRSLPPEAVIFTPRRSWKSPRTGTSYPVGMEFSLEGHTWRVIPMLDDQELDARSSTGTLYWEGAVRVEGPAGEKGRGYLELTGYAQRLPF